MVFGREGIHLLIQIDDDFDLQKIAESGQCFRVMRLPSGAYRFITGDHVLEIKPAGAGAFHISCDAAEWEEVWQPYFDFSRSYREIFDRERDKHPFIKEAMEAGAGLRVLRQDPWELLVTFIISQRKSIPAIARAVETLAARYGKPRGDVHAFPTPEELGKATEKDLLDCGLGYRAKYVADAAGQVLSGRLDLAALQEASDEELLGRLMEVKGVGIKVASCVALFAYGRTGCVPVDVWIRRAIDEDCGGQSPFDLFGENAGIIQQYVFFFETHQKKHKKL